MVDQMMHAHPRTESQGTNAPITISGEGHNIVIHANAPVFIVTFDENATMSSDQASAGPESGEPRKRP